LVRFNIKEESHQLSGSKPELVSPLTTVPAKFRNENLILLLSLFPVKEFIAGATDLYMSAVGSDERNSLVEARYNGAIVTVGTGCRSGLEQP
jgi:hypothetical protein